MDLFEVVEDALVVLFSRGVYRQLPVFRRGDKFFAKVGAGFVRLHRGGSTTVPAIRWIDHEGFEAP